MKLTLENIGKVKHAEIDLSKNLIVLCGPINTGKTDLADRVHGLPSRMKRLFAASKGGLRDAVVDRSFDKLEIVKLITEFDFKAFFMLKIFHAKWPSSAQSPK